jgi:hypothetical protein
MMIIMNVSNCAFAQQQSYHQYENQSQDYDQERSYASLVKSSVRKIVTPLKTQYYDDLPPKGKFAAGAFAGFAGCKLTSKTITKGVKFTGMAFIVSEVLNQAGLLDSSDDDSQSGQVLNQVKETTRSYINNIRSNIRQNISLDHIRSVYKTMMEDDRMGTCGLTTGVLAGLIW